MERRTWSTPEYYAIAVANQADCRFKTAKCHVCQKTGHLARVCLSQQRTDATNKPQRPKDDDSGGSTEGYLHNIFQLGNTTRKFIVTVCINRVELDMEVDSGAERTTMPWSIFQEKLVDVCDLTPTTVTLRQYDQSPLTVKGQCHVKVKLNERTFEANFLVVDVSTQYPLFGRDWMTLIGFNVSSLIQEATQVHNTTEVLTAESLCEEYSEIFKDELGILKGIEATISVNPQAAPKFHRYRPVPFAVKEKVEKTLRAQVAEGELTPVEASEWGCTHCCCT